MSDCTYIHTRLPDISRFLLATKRYFLEVSSSRFLLFVDEVLRIVVLFKFFRASAYMYSSTLTAVAGILEQLFFKLVNELNSGGVIFHLISNLDLHKRPK